MMSAEKKRMYAMLVGAAWLAVSSYHFLVLAFAPVIDVRVTDRHYRTRPRGAHLKFRLPSGEQREVPEHWIAARVNVGEKIAVQKSPLFDAYERRHWYSAFRYLVLFTFVALIAWLLIVLPSRKKN